MRIMIYVLITGMTMMLMNACGTSGNTPGSEKELSNVSESVSNTSGAETVSDDLQDSRAENLANYVSIVSCMEGNTTISTGDTIENPEGAKLKIIMNSLDEKSVCTESGNNAYIWRGES